MKINQKIWGFLLMFCPIWVNAQPQIVPSKDRQNVIIKNATIHIGNGQVLNNANLWIKDGKIVDLGNSLSASGTTELDASGKHVYPGLILSSSIVGLREIASSVKGSNDFDELGAVNPDVRSIVAYNTDGNIINTLRTNGILLVNVVPLGDLISGKSSVVQLDAWNWEDAAYVIDNGMHVYMPRLINRPDGRSENISREDPIKNGMEKVEMVKKYFRDAKSYLSQSKPERTNLKLEAAKPLFEKRMKLFVHAELVREMLVAIDFAKEFGFDVVIVGGCESFQIAPLLRDNQIAVVLSQMHTLPISEDDDVDQPYKTPKILQDAGVLFAINDEDENSAFRNLPFNAGTAVEYGLSKEQALQAITLNAAKILGIDAQTGSISKGKDANIVISDGDILDPKSNRITNAWIQGRAIQLENKQMQLEKRYNTKFGLH